MFWLGTHEPHWLKRSPHPLFISRRRLLRLNVMPVARVAWALDSGGFSELSLYGKWRTTPEQYVADVERYAYEIGMMQWAAPMDWMCEPHMLAKTGKSLRYHQFLTVENYLLLKELGDDLPFIPVLQGWQHEDYWDCIEMYDDAGVNLYDEPIVGIGSVCRRQSTKEIREIITDLASAGLRLHGFGVKQSGIQGYGDVLTSADSLAWSYAASKRGPLPECTHQRCNNCYRFAMEWRDHVLGRKVMLRT
jgi:hypothetical protein